MHERDEKTIDQEKYLSILVYSFESECWEDMLRMALQVPLLMHIGRLLCFDRIPNSGSEHIAASSYMLRVFCHALWLGSQAKNSFMLVIDDIGEPSKAFAHSTNPSEIKRTDERDECKDMVVDQVLGTIKTILSYRLIVLL